jgi:CRP-like cAMP-binding protein
MQDQIIETLRALPHFNRLDDKTVARLAASSRLLRLKKGEQIVREGEPCRSFFAVRSGSVRVYRLAEDGRIQSLHRLRPGQSFAEAAVLNMASYPASAEATDDGTEVVEIGAATFLVLFDTDPRLPRAIIGSLCSWLHQMVSRVEELSVLSAGARLARNLLDLPARETPEGLAVTLPTSKRELAERLGITPETLSRQLRRWHDQQLILSERNRIVLVDTDTLMAIATES